MKRIVWQSPDGALRITVPVEFPRDGELEQAYLDRIALHARGADPTLAECVRVNDAAVAALPTSRRFRNCWRADQGIVIVDLPLARAQVLAEVRAERNTRLGAADQEKARLDDLGTAGAKATLAAYRQRLRDLPTLVQADLAALVTAAALEAYQPAWPAYSAS